MATRKKSILRKWAEGEAARIEAEQAAKTFKQPPAPARGRNTATGRDWAEGITQDVLDARKSSVASAIKANPVPLQNQSVMAASRYGNEGVSTPLASPIAQPKAAPVLPGIMARARTADENFAEVNALREKARANGTLTAEGAGISGMSNNASPSGVVSRFNAFASRAGGPIAPPSSEPFVPVSESAMDFVMSRVGPKVPSGVVAGDGMRPAVQQEPGAQATPGSGEKLDEIGKSIADGVKQRGQRQQSMASFVLQKKPSQLPGLTSWSSGNNPNAIKPNRPMASLPVVRTGINSTYDPNFEA